MPADPLVLVPLEQLRQIIREELAALRTAEAMPGDGLVTVREAARRLGKSVRHVQRCLRDGRLQEDAPIGGVRMVRWPSTARSE